MRFYFTKFGLPQLVIFPCVVVFLMFQSFIFLRNSLCFVFVEIVLFLLLLWIFSFFRDPKRNIVKDENILYSPADGVITGVDLVEESPLECKALRVGVFLSLFNVHINRAPCSARVDAVLYKKGAFKNAASKDAGEVNESNNVFMTRASEPFCKILVRQISGVAARHIVCRAKAGSEYSQGEKFGMIKFGSRTELYIPADGDFSYKVLIKKGDVVKAGTTPLIVFK
ncbi:MAG: phosphatidylserine decarboxylase [Spirochaetaceae bacterium]|jgi:phosphatidylserine decarboxylase|nr:phosphatidylserine decarboxylase [Spirochaetaceae bacterium]